MIRPAAAWCACLPGSDDRRAGHYPGSPRSVAAEACRSVRVAVVALLVLVRADDGEVLVQLDLDLAAVVEVDLDLVVVLLVLDLAVDDLARRRSRRARPRWPATGPSPVMATSGPSSPPPESAAAATPAAATRR